MKKRRDKQVSLEDSIRVKNRRRSAFHEGLKCLKALKMKNLPDTTINHLRLSLDRAVMAVAGAPEFVDLQVMPVVPTTDKNFPQLLNQIQFNGHAVSCNLDPMKFINQGRPQNFYWCVGLSLDDAHNQRLSPHQVREEYLSKLVYPKDNVYVYAQEIIACAILLSSGPLFIQKDLVSLSTWYVDNDLVMKPVAFYLFGGMLTLGLVAPDKENPRNTYCKVYCRVD